MAVAAAAAGAAVTVKRGGKGEPFEHTAKRLMRRRVVASADPLACCRWPFGRYSWRGLLARLEPQVLVLPREQSGYTIELSYCVPDRDNAGVLVRLTERRDVARLQAPTDLDAIVYALLRSVLAHEVDEGMLVRDTGGLAVAPDSVCPRPYRDAHPNGAASREAAIAECIAAQIERRESLPPGAVDVDRLRALIFDMKI